MAHDILAHFINNVFSSKVVDPTPEPDPDIPTKRIRGELNIAHIDIGKRNRIKFAPHWHARDRTGTGCTPFEAVQKHIEHGYDSINSMNHDIDMSNQLVHILAGMEHRAGRDDIVEHTLVLYSTNHQTYQDYQDDDAIMVRAHPNDPGRPAYTVQEMADQFKKYPNLIGLEMFSRNYHPTEGLPGDDIHPHRRGEGQYVRSGQIWDELLTDYELKIFGIGATDGYCDMDIVLGDNHYDTAWTDIISDDLEEESVKQAFMNGHLFGVSHMDFDKQPPKVTNINISENSIDLDIIGEYEEVYWIYNHELVGTGTSYPLKKWEEGQNYVRFEVWSRKSDYWENNHNIMDDPFDSPFYKANIVIGQPVFEDDLIR